jgi:bile acid:Na+ symporter, BASS family
MNSIDTAQINANDGNMLILQICLAFILFSLAIDIKKDDFKTLLTNPKAVLIGCVSQMVILPFATYLIILWLKPVPSIALGMILVAACPCGNMSTYISYLAKGFIPLSITITTISTLSASFTTPFSFYLYASQYGPAQGLLHAIEIDFFELLRSVALILFLPLITGILARHFFPAFIQQINKPVKILALLLFLVFLVGAFITNSKVFIEFLPSIFGVVFIQNALAFAIGYYFARLFNLPEDQSRSVSIETGIHNSGLGLILVMTFFKGNGGMALIAAWWGIWHIVVGVALAQFWRWRDQRALSRSNE